jgi:hypothetical protein
MRGQYSIDWEPVLGNPYVCGRPNAFLESKCDSYNAWNVHLRLPRMNIGADVWGGSSIITGVC